MKEFFKIMFASMLGTLVLIAVVFAVGFIIVAGIVAAASTEKTVVSDNSVLHLRLNKEIPDRGSNNVMVMGFAGPEKSLGLNDVINTISKAGRDDKIKGIYLDLTDIPAGITTVREIREALVSFKKSGKFIWAYSEIYTQKSYYLASVADKVFLNPQGSVEFKGLSTEMPFLKGMLAKLDIRMQIIRHGKYKSAAEPLFLDKMSPENREQITSLIADIWDDLTVTISDARKIDREELNRIADSLKLRNADDALQYKFVDQLVYKDELLGLMRKQLNLKEKAKIGFVSLDDYNTADDPEKPSFSNNKIAVIYANGSIGSGEGDDQSIGSERISKAIRKAREDENVKAIVFRINSGGGSALASDVIWREVALARQTKPVVASFGDVAASGGYYIACAASRIVAAPTTITGSIGVFGVIPDFGGMFNKKLGITFDGTMTNKNSDYIPVTKPLSTYQTLVIQKEVDHIYDVFAGKVADGRKLAISRVDSIGQGRVWSGTDAREIGLVDEFGGLTRSLEIAADLAKLKDYRVVSLPEQKEWFEELLDEISGKDPEAGIRQVLGTDYRYYQYIKEIREMSGVQARMLYDIRVD